MNKNQWSMDVDYNNGLELMIKWKMSWLVGLELQQPNQHEIKMRWIEFEFKLPEKWNVLPLI